MSVRQHILPAAAIGVAAATALVGAVLAYGDPSAVAIGRGARGPGERHSAIAGDSGPDGRSAGDAPVVFLAAGLSGTNEVRTTPGFSGGDRDGRATAVVRIEGDQLSYAVRWQNISAPTAFHLHQGGVGVNGAVRIDILDADLPGGRQAAYGSVTVTDPGLLDSIRADPTAFYLNLQTAQYPAGAVRGQVGALKVAVDLSGVLNGSSTADLEPNTGSEYDVSVAKPEHGRDRTRR